MSIKSVGFVGGGRIANIMLGGWTKADRLPSKIVVSDPNSAALEALKKRYVAIETSAHNTVAAAQEVVVLAVHPPVAKEVLPGLSPCLRGKQVLISLLPNLSVEKLQRILGGFSRIARLIPNAPSIIGEGYNPIAFSGALSEEDKRSLRELLAPLGESPEVEESTLEAYAVITAMGPTYFWPQLYELKSLAESFGLSSQAAMEGIDKMLRGAAATMKDSGLSPDQVQDLIPVKPLAEIEQTVIHAYRSKLTALMNKLRS